MKSVAVAGVAVLLGGGMLLAQAPPAKTRAGGYVTSLQGRTTNQKHNAKLALSKLVGFELKPGETFSFNGRVGTWTRDQGYRRAPVSYNGTLIDAWGGGVCQTSTTVYNAGLLAGLEILQRHPHRFAPNYAPPGRDAAVAFSNIDLQMKNPYDFPLKLRGEIQGNDLRVWWEVEGRHAGEVKKGLVITDVKGHVGATSIEVTRASADASTLPQASAYIRNAGKSGWETATYRLIDGRKELVSTDSYPAMDRVVELR